METHRFLQAMEAARHRCDERWKEDGQVGVSRAPMPAKGPRWRPQASIISASLLVRHSKSHYDGTLTGDDFNNDR